MRADLVRFLTDKAGDAGKYCVIGTEPVSAPRFLAFFGVDFVASLSLAGFKLSW